MSSRDRSVSQRLDRASDLATKKEILKDCIHRHTNTLRDLLAWLPRDNAGEISYILQNQLKATLSVIDRIKEMD